MDLTANYVKKNDPDFIKALGGDEEAKSAFISTKTKQDNGWKKVNSDVSAWKKEGSDYYLSQFGDYYDLQMTSPVAQQKLIDALNKFVDMGVKGFRLKNAKHFIINEELKSEQPKNNPGASNDYNLKTHGQTVYQDGLGDVIRNFTKVVHNSTGGDGFLTITDDAKSRAENLVISNTKFYGFDLPDFKFLNSFVGKSSADVAKNLHNSFETISTDIDMSSLWLQVAYRPSDFKALSSAAYNLFMSFLPGVQVVPIETFEFAVNDTKVLTKLKEARDSPAFQHGDFNFFLSANETAFGYTR